jgi:maltose O-acetyltransferase
MLAGDQYIADDPDLQREALRAAQLVAAYNASAADAPEVRRRILGELLGGVGQGVAIRPPFYCDYGYHIASAIGRSPTLG